MRGARPFYVDSTPLERAMMRTVVGLTLALMAFCAGYLVVALPAANPPWWALAVGLLCGYFVADFVSGVVHWAMDTWFEADRLGRFVAIAREHHTHPQNILGYSFLEHAALGATPTTPLAAIAAAAIALSPPSPWGYAGMLAVLIVTTCLLLGNNFHNLGHRRPRSPLLRLAQRLGLVMSPEHHGVHHAGDHTIRYCVVNGWADPICERLGVWRGLERLVSLVTGAEPREDDIAFDQRFRETGEMPQYR